MRHSRQKSSGTQGAKIYKIVKGKVENAGEADWRSIHQLTGKMEKVSIDDACAFLCHFNNGSLGLFESTRYARGHKALYTLEINGEHASIKWDLHDLHRLQMFDYKDEGKIRGWKSIHVTDNGGEHPYMDKWWVPGLAVGYDCSFTHQVADFIQGLETGTPAGPTFRSHRAAEDREFLASTDGWFRPVYAATGPDGALYLLRPLGNVITRIEVSDLSADGSRLAGGRQGRVLVM